MRRRVLNFVVVATVLACTIAGVASTPVAASAGGRYAAPSTARAVVNLDGGWSFMRADAAGAEASGFDDGGWTRLDLPHSWNAADGQDGGGDYYRGVGWYRRHVSLPAEYASRKLYLQFDGASLVADVYVNGIHVGRHEGAFSAFRFDVTGLLLPGADAVVAVKVSNAANADVAPLGGDFTLFGGLYRSVGLLVTDPLQVSALDYGSSGVFLTPTHIGVDQAEVNVRSEIANGTTSAASVTVNATVVDADGAVVADSATDSDIAAAGQADVNQTVTIPEPRLWDARNDPYLYTVYVEVRHDDVVTDVVSQPLGLRSFAMDPNSGFSLNGHPYDLHGVSFHQDRLDKGWGISTADEDSDFAFVNELGATAIRLAHYQHGQHIYDLADRSGVVVWAELPLINNPSSSAAFGDNAARQLTELIRQNYNHPSVVVWSIGNEVRYPPDPNALMERLDALAHAEDSTRPTTNASGREDYDNPVNWHTDTIGFNRYYGWYSDTFATFATTMDAIHAAYPSVPMAVSEYGAGSSVRIHSDRPKIRDHSEEYQNAFHEAHWAMLQDRPYIWAKFVWNLFDFAADQRAEGDTNGRNDKGLVTYDRSIRKDAFYWYKANWSREPVVYITSRRNDVRLNATTDIKVYANTDTVELFVNGVSLGSRVSANHAFVWSGVTLPAGTSAIEAVGASGGSAYRDAVQWTVLAAPFTNLRLNAGTAATYADAAGQVYLGDAYASGGSNGIVDTVPIANTNDDAAIRTYRYGTNFSYAIPVANATYAITLTFMEPTCAAAGCRVFNVAAEGATVLSQLDLFAAGGNLGAVTRVVQATVRDGTLNLQFSGSTGEAAVSTIALAKTDVPLDATPPATPTGLSAAVSDGAVTLSWTANGEPDLAGYDVYRSDRQGGTFVKLNPTPITTPTYADPAAPTGATAYYRVTARDAAGNESAPAEASATRPAPPSGTPLPGTFQAEDYSSAGRGLGYFDTTTGNSGGLYRADDVDIQKCVDPATPQSICYNIGWVVAGEWLKYDVNVLAAGSYTVTVRVATPNSGRSLHLELDGVRLGATAALPNTGGFQNWADLVIGPVNLTAGGHALKIVADTSSFNLNAVTVAPAAAPVAGGIALPGVIQAEDYNHGANRVAYYDTTPGNAGGAYGRNDDGDIGVCADTPAPCYFVGWAVAGEWLKYDVNIAATGSFALTARVASAASGKTFHLELDGVKIGATVKVPNTGGWQNWRSVAIGTVTLKQGPHTLRLVQDTGNINVNYLTVAASP